MGKQDDSICDNCGNKINKWEYRLVNGTSWEGISIREIYYDESGNIIGWSSHPLIMLASSVEEVTNELVKAMTQIDDMLEAIKKPVLDEALLETAIGE